MKRYLIIALLAFSSATFVHSALTKSKEHQAIDQQKQATKKTKCKKAKKKSPFYVPLEPGPVMIDAKK